MSQDGRLLGDMLVNLAPGEVLETIIQRAAELNVSDVFLLSEEAGLRSRRLSPHGRDGNSRPRYRWKWQKSVITHCWAESGIDLGDRRRFHEAVSTFKRLAIVWSTCESMSFRRCMVKMSPPGFLTANSDFGRSSRLV